MRAFLAIEMSGEVRECYAAFHAESSRGHGDLRWVRPENLHLTVRFLGDTPERKVDAIRERLEDAARAVPAFRASVGAPGAFGPRNSPQVLWFGIADGSSQLLQLEERIDAPLSKLGFPRVMVDSSCINSVSARWEALACPHHRGPQSAQGSV